LNKIDIDVIEHLISSTLPIQQQVNSLNKANLHLAYIRQPKVE